MKKLITALLILAPCLCFGQVESSMDLKLNTEAKVTAKVIKPIDPSVQNMPLKNMWISCSCNKTNPDLTLIDGVEGDINKISPDKIKSVKMLTGKEATRLYGKAGKNGVILVTTKEYAKKIEEEKEFWIDCGCNRTQKALVFIDGIKGVGEDIKNIPPQTIITFDVLKGEDAIKRYGEAGKDGVILVTTTEGTKKAEDEYEIVVLSPGYESFLATQKPMDFYSESSLKAKNIQMVKEWNFRYNLPTQYSSDIYEVSIDYDSNYDYGLEFEYRLHMFFRFMEKEHNMSLTGNRLTAKM